MPHVHVVNFFVVRKITTAGVGWSEIAGASGIRRLFTFFREREDKEKLNFLTFFSDGAVVG